MDFFHYCEIMRFGTQSGVQFGKGAFGKNSKGCESFFTRPREGIDSDEFYFWQERGERI